MRLEQKKAHYLPFETANDEIVQQFRPDLGIDIDLDGDFFGDQIYEGTAPWAARIMATGFQGNTISKAIDWLFYKMQQEDLNGIDEIDIWLQKRKEHMVGVYRRSNFYDVQPKFTLDAFTIGSPVMMIEEDVQEDRIIFRPQYYKHVYVCYDRNNRPNGLLVEDPTWTAQEIFEEFVGQEQGYDDKNAERRKKLSRAVNKALDDGNYYEKFTIIRGIFRDTDKIWDADGFEKPNMPWISVYYEQSKDKDKKSEPLKTSGYFSRPFEVWDYDKNPWEAKSRTPAFDAIYDCYSLQQTQKNYMENTLLKNNPPRWVYDTTINKLDLGPEGLTAVSGEEYDRPPRALDLIGDIQWSKELLSQLQESTKRHFHLDLFYQFNQLAIQKGNSLPKIQIWQMMGEKSTLLSPAIETQGQYLTDVDARMTEIEERKGRGPFHPNEIANLMDVIFSQSDKVIQTLKPVAEFLGPLARAQRTQQALEPIQSGIQAAAPMFQLDPDLVHAIRGYDTVDDILTAAGFPQKDIVTKEEFNKIKESLNQQRAQAQQTANMIEMMKASKPAADAMGQLMGAENG